MIGEYGEMDDIVKKIEEVVSKWYKDGMATWSSAGAEDGDDGMFEGSFHYIGNMKLVSDEVYKFYFDLGSANQHEAEDNLKDRLAPLGFTCSVSSGDIKIFKIEDNKLRKEIRKTIREQQVPSSKKIKRRLITSPFVEINFGEMTIGDLDIILERSGYTENNLRTIKFVGAKRGGSARYLITYRDDVEGEVQEGYVYVFIGENGLLQADF
jgi:hypothetical protein